LATPLSVSRFSAPVANSSSRLKSDNAERMLFLRAQQRTLLEHQHRVSGARQVGVRSVRRRRRCR
jgi:hypothetical protein